MNPMAFMRIKPLFEKFRERHPKFVQFFGYAAQNLGEGSKLEISITDANGNTAKTNIIVAPEDVELISQFRSLMK